MKADSKFLNKYVKTMTETMLRVDPSLDKSEVKDTIIEMIKEQAENPRVRLDNNYTGESRDTTLLSVFDWALDRKPILCGNATFYKNQHEAMNPIAKMLEDFLAQRKVYKKQMFQVEDSTSNKYKDFDRSQANEKTNCNSYYGASGAPSSAFYSRWSGPATTHSAQEVISTAETLFEGFISDNYIFINLTECIEWIRTVTKPYVKGEEKIDDWVMLHSWNEVVDRIYSKVMNPKDEDREILEQYLESFTDEQLTVIYYKNNLTEFIKDHTVIQDLIIDIFDNIENLDYAEKDDDRWFEKVVPSKYQNEFIGKTWKEWNKFVNSQYFMDPNDVPESIANTLYILKEYLMKYIYCKYLSVDRIYRLKNFKREVVTVIDTDSNILSLDTIIDFIMDDVIKGNSFGREFTNNIFICVNMLAYILTEAVTDILLTFGEHSNIPEEFRPIYNMKNEFLFLKLIIGRTKKRYISKIVLREGNLMNPPKYDIKGFDFKKATTSEYAEARYMEILKNHVINSPDIQIREIIRELKKFKIEVRESIERGERKYLPNLAAKDPQAYKNPASQQAVKSVNAWNMLYPDNRIDVPTKVSILKLNIFDEEDLLPLKDIDEEKYNIILNGIFNDKTGIFVQPIWEPGVEFINPRLAAKNKDWPKQIPEKYRSKYRKLGVDAWNKFVEDYDHDSPTAEKGHYKYKKVGLQVLAIPSNANIPAWCQPFIDYTTIVNNIIQPFNPVLDIFKTQALEEGKLRKGVNRKTKTFSNVIKF